MLNTAILIAALLVLVVSVKRLYSTLTVGSMEQLVNRSGVALTNLEEFAANLTQKVYLFLLGCLMLCCYLQQQH